MTSVAEPTTSGTPGRAAKRPDPPKPPLSTYLGLLALAVAAFGVFWWTRESSEVLFIPLGLATPWVPQYPFFGFLVMLAVLVLCWRIRAGAMAAFGALGFVIFTYWAGSRIDFTLLLRWGNLGDVLEPYLRPNWNYLFFGQTTVNTPIWGEWLITLCMAIVATAIGCLIGLLLAMAASPVSSPNKASSQIIKAINSVIRSIPDVGYALLFAAIIGTGGGLGALSAVLALTMFNIGIVAKLLGESIDSVHLGPLEASDAAGANLIQRDRVAVLPQVLPSFVSYSLYVFELNIRASAALGVVGVAGIGSQISVQMDRFAWENVAAILYALIFVVLLVDLLSMWIRRKLL